MAEQQIINIGQVPNDGSGDSLRVAFGKINNNFTNLFETSTSTSNSYTSGNTANQVIFETPANTFTQGYFTIRSKDPGTNFSQAIQLFAQIRPDATEVKFTGYGFNSFGDPLASFDMDISGGNVRILCSPLTEQSVFHFISSQVLFQGENIPGLDIALDGYVDSVMSTENDFIISTED